MKKEQRKTSKKNNTKRSDSKTDFDDLGLEPPKIYRDTQAYKKQQERLAQEKRSKKNSSKTSGKKSQQESMTRAERRAHETKKRKKKNLLRKLFMWFITAVMLIGVGIVLSLTVFFKIGEVSVVGNERYDTEEILSQCSIDVGENLFMSDTENAERMLERNLPYIYQADIKRKLPDKIVINITEAQPSYYITNEDETYLLLDDNFKVLETAAEEAGKMEIISTEITSAPTGQTIEFADENISESLKIISQTIRENGFTEFTGISSEGLNNNYIIYDRRITFKLGTTQDLEKKIYQGLATCKELDETSPNVEGEITITGGKQIYFTEK